MVSKVFAVSGSILQKNLDNLDKFAEALQRDEQILVVTGAGELKKYIKASNGNQAEKDLVGIKATHLNAQTLLSSMDNVYPSIPETSEEILEAASTGKDVVMGGLVPGYSTDAVAATAAELLDAELYIASTVNGVYTADPESKDAKKLADATPEKLNELIHGNNEAGNHALIDQTAVNLIERSKIHTRIFEGTLENLNRPKNAKGTRIVFDRP